MIVVDAHEDLAWNALTFGRDYMRSVVETRAHERGTPIPERNKGQAMIGHPEWVEGRVGVVFATLFASPLEKQEGDWDTQVYRDIETANACYRSDLDYYRRLFSDHPDLVCPIRSQRDLKRVRDAWESDFEQPPPVGLILLMEGADGVREPGELGWWYDAGLRILGPAWTRTRYAGGTESPGPLTDLGRELLRTMSEYNLVLDLSHLSPEGAFEALERYDGPIIASHISPLELVPNAVKPERHFSSEMIRLCAEREVVMGMVLANDFLRDGWTYGQDRGAVTLQDVAHAIDGICQMLGEARWVGIGSDLDGGFGLESVPAGLDSIADLRLIGEALEEEGYSAAETQAVLGGNWLRVLSQSLPES
ncbi:MAG: membrane dipeptidase [Anaerolineales bacterium]|jgi:membrane dipeptidase